MRNDSHFKLNYSIIEIHVRNEIYTIDKNKPTMKKETVKQIRVHVFNI